MGLTLFDIPVEPFNERIIRFVEQNNCFIDYKTNWTTILKDKEAYELRTEPYHKKMLRLEEEAKKREILEKEQAEA